VTKPSAEPQPRSSEPAIPQPRRRRASRIGGSILALASTLGLLTIVASSCRTEPIPTEAPALGASLELAAGEVVLVTESGDEVALLSNTPLPIGAALRTGAGARALVRLGDGTRVFLRDGTRVTLGDGLRLESGHAWVDAPPLEQGRRAAVHSCGAVQVAVSDGGASLSHVDGKVEIYVAEGLAIVTSPGGRTELAPGELARVEGKGEPQVEPVKFWPDWTGGMGDHSSAASSPWIGTGSVYAIDHMAGAAALPLAIQRQSVEVAIDEQVAETKVDQVFFNPASEDVEGWYWFTVPADAMIVGFALEVDGQLVDGEVVERKHAAATFEGSIARRVDPALLEWVDARTVRARIYPIPGAGTRRVVLRYQQLLSETEGKLRYRYPMAAPVGREAATIEEFSLQVQLRGEISERYGLATRNDARVEGRDRNRVTMRRSGFVPRADFELELTRKVATSEKDKPSPLRLNSFQPGADQADFVLLRWTPDIEFTAGAAPKGEVVVVVDTSAGSDPSEHQAKLAVAEALLRSLAEDDQFVLVGADLGAEVLYPDEGMAAATPAAISAALERLAARGSGGATDLGAIFEQSLARVHGRTQPAIVYIGDGVATSGEIAGEAIADRLRRSLAGSPARLFTVAVGREVDEALLTKLAQVGGGRSLRVDDPNDAVLRALELSGALKTPTLTNLVVDAGEGLDDVFASAEGKLSRGEELTILARTHHELPKSVTISFRFAGEDYQRDYELVRDKHSAVLNRLVPRLWAHAYVQELLTDTRGPEAVRGKVLTLGIEYGLMTPFTSFLALENDAAYRRAGIERRRRDFPLLTDAGAWQDGSPRESSAPPTLLSMLGAAASAPLGCMPGPERPAQTGEGDGEDRAARNELGRNRGAQTRGPAPSATAPSDLRLSEAHDYADDDQVAPAGQGEPQQARRSGSLGVLRLDAAAADGFGGDRSQRLAAAGFGAAPPRWVAEVTESELARSTLSGKPRVPTSTVAREQVQPCSAAATRSLAHRRALWAARLDREAGMAGKLRVYEATSAACELRRWRDQQAFLDLLQERAQTEAEIRLLLGHFYADLDARLFLTQALLRRLVDPQLIAAVNYAMYGGVESWWEVDRRLDVTDDPDERLRLLDAALANAPGDPDGERRMLAELVAQGRRDDAIARGLRLRSQGQMTPELVMIVGELLVDAGRDDAAKRLFSELVEFSPHGIDSRRLLGDIFLRHRWYADAYRQYELLLSLSETPDIAIRMARAAAGTGRTDEALRLLGRVQSGEGRPGDADPRRFARLHAAAVLAFLLDTEAAERSQLESRLKSLNLFEGPATWELLIWEDLGASLTLAGVDGKVAVQADGVDASDTGLFARQYAGGVPALSVRHAGLVPDRAVSWERITLKWDGEAFVVGRSKGVIEAKVARAAAVVDEDEDGEE
jgi:Ca-activated chloride channel homolog